jgi:glycosyl transferase family 25
MEIFVITLRGSEKRQRSIASQLHALNISFEFFEGVDGRNMSSDEILKHYDTRKANKYLERDLIKGEIGCALSHKYIYEKMITDNIQRAIVLEDDIIIDDNFSTVICLLDKLAIDNYIVKLDSVEKQTVPWHKIRLNDTYCIEHPLSSVAYTWGYYIDIFAAKKMLTVLDKVFLEADNWTYFKSFIKLRILNKRVITDNSIFNSEIGEREDGPDEHIIYKIRIANKVIKFIKLLITLFH